MSFGLGATRSSPPDHRAGRPLTTIMRLQTGCTSSCPIVSHSLDKFLSRLLTGGFFGVGRGFSAQIVFFPWQVVGRGQVAARAISRLCHRQFDPVVIDANVVGTVVCAMNSIQAAPHWLFHHLNRAIRSLRCAWAARPMLRSSEPMSGRTGRETCPKHMPRRQNFVKSYAENRAEKSFRKFRNRAENGQPSLIFLRD